MKAFTLCTILILHIGLAIAQAPQQFSFQGVARKADGKVAVNEQIGVRISIIAESAFGTLLYQETHSLLTNLVGVFDISIGGGVVQSGDLSSIDWGKGKYFLQLEIDVTGGTNYVNIGVTQLLSVPYALHAHSAASWMHNHPVIQTGLFQGGGQLSSPGDGPRLIWYPRKAAMAVGYNAGNAWDDINLGEYSFATGNQSIAKGKASVAVGWQSHADGVYSVAAGEKANAIGDGSVALGLGTVSKAVGSVSLGAFNDAQDSPAPNGQGASMTDRIFQIGNGLSPQSTSNAFTVLRNGNVGIGKGVTTPQFPLDVDGRIRLKHLGNTTAGIHFNNSQNTTSGFVGMVSDSQVGFYAGNSWKFWVDEADKGFMRGKLGIGADIFEPEYTLDVAGRARLRHSTNATAGLYFNDSQNNVSGFLGMINDEKIGFYIGSKWRFQVKGNGNVGIGDDVTDPTQLLDVGGRVRLRHHGNTTSGILLDNSQGNQGGFVGMVSDSQLGFHLGNSWKFWVDQTGNGFFRGKLGIGTEIFVPKYPLDVEGKIRIQHKPERPATLYFDGSKQNGVGNPITVRDSVVRIAMSTDQPILQFKFWSPNNFKEYISLQVHEAGITTQSIWLYGQVNQISDARLKRNVAHLEQSLPRISLLNGYNYNWKTGDNYALQTGVLAQEVEKIFPELVCTDENGTKSVNYIGLIPHLIESIKVLKVENCELVKANGNFNSRLADLEKRIADIVYYAAALKEGIGE